MRGPYQEKFTDSREIPHAHERKDSRKEQVISLLRGAGHFVNRWVVSWVVFNFSKFSVLSVHDQPAVVKSIVEHWIENKPFTYRRVNRHVSVISFTVVRPKG